MGKSKSHSLARLPRDQRCHFLIGPMSSWFMPNTSDLWTRPLSTLEGLSYFVYGSLGCFCYGTIHRVLDKDHRDTHQASTISAIVRHLVDIKEDNSRISCIRFLKPSTIPIVMALTESGSFIIHNCIGDETLIHMRKTELISKLIDTPMNHDNSGEHHTKKTKLNNMQQINSFSWPNTTNVFLGVSLVDAKTNSVIWLKLKDLTTQNEPCQQITKSDFIESHLKFDLDSSKCYSPVCCMDSILIDQNSSLVALAMDHGSIQVIVVNFNANQPKRVINLDRHIDQVCSLSIAMPDKEKFPLGLLASVSRNGLTFIWDIERGYYFADYLAGGGGANIPINWFSLRFLTDNDTNTTTLGISNSDNSLTVLEVPKVTSVKKRLKNPTKERPQRGAQPLMRHQALIFNVIFDPVSRITMTSSLDGNHILWTNRRSISNSLDLLEPRYLIPSLPNNSRVHMLRHSPIQENLLGLCLGKAGVRFYKITENLGHSRFDMSPGASLISRRLIKAAMCPTSLAWHPGNEYRVAIGTIEGKVLRVDLAPNRTSFIEAECRKTKSRKGAEPMSVDRISAEDDLFGVDYQPVSHAAEDDDCSDKSLKTDGVYSICWGPNPTCPDDENRLAIYVVRSISHKLSIYYNINRDASDRLTDYLDEFLDESLPEAIGEASEVAWKSTFDLMALGTTHGKVIIVEYLEESHADRSRNRLFRKLAVIKDSMGSTYIQCLVWHPTLDETDARYHHIACSANESPVFVFDIRQAREDSKLATDVKTKLKIEDSVELSTLDIARGGGPLIITNFLYKLDAHKKPVSDIAWNPHNSNQIATCSFDRYCYVWYLDGTSESAKLCSKYSARDRLFSLDWSLVDDDLLYTSGHDSIVWAWRPSENPAIQ